jgi:hypothetical protein
MKGKERLEAQLPHQIVLCDELVERLQGRLGSSNKDLD